MSIIQMSPYHIVQMSNSRYIFDIWFYFKSTLLRKCNVKISNEYLYQRANEYLQNIFQCSSLNILYILISTH